MIVEGITQELLDKKRASIHSSDKKDILSILVRDNLGSEDPLTDKEIMDQCLTFLAAGHGEMTSRTLRDPPQRRRAPPSLGPYNVWQRTQTSSRSSVKRSSK
jgi:hypothetical protein